MYRVAIVEKRRNYGTEVFCRRAFRFIELKEFSASIISISSVSLDSNILCVACIAVSHLASCSEHICKLRAAILMSFFTTFITTFLAIRSRTSPTLIGRFCGRPKYHVVNNITCVVLLAKFDV